MASVSHSFTTQSFFPSVVKQARGFVSVQIFERVKHLYGCCFSSGNEELFCDTIFPKKPTFSLLEKDVR